MHNLKSIPIIYFGNIFSASIFLSVVHEKLSIYVSVQIYSLKNRKFFIPWSQWLILLESHNFENEITGAWKYGNGRRLM